MWMGSHYPKGSLAWQSALLSCPGTRRPEALWSCLGAQRSGNWPSQLGGCTTWQLQGLELEEALAIIQGLF